MTCVLDCARTALNAVHLFEVVHLLALAMKFVNSDSDEENDTSLSEAYKVLRLKFHEAV